jgi:hypothetical protein
MKQGLLWYDNDSKKSLEAKLADAVSRYKEKYGAEPSVCYVHPTHIDQARPTYGKIKMVKADRMQPNHLWLEIDK